MLQIQHDQPLFSIHIIVWCTPFGHSMYVADFIILLPCQTSISGRSTGWDGGGEGGWQPILFYVRMQNIKWSLCTAYKEWRSMQLTLRNIHTQVFKVQKICIDVKEGLNTSRSNNQAQAVFFNLRQPNNRCQKEECRG